MRVITEKNVIYFDSAICMIESKLFMVPIISSRGMSKNIFKTV